MGGEEAAAVATGGCRADGVGAEGAVVTRRSSPDSVRSHPYIESRGVGAVHTTLSSSFRTVIAYLVSDESPRNTGIKLTVFFVLMRVVLSVAAEICATPVAASYRRVPRDTTTV